MTGNHDPLDGFWAPQAKQVLMVKVPYKPSPYMRRLLRWTTAATNRALRMWNGWPYHTAREAGAAKAAGRAIPDKEGFNAYGRMVYGETKDHAGRYATIIAAGIARRARSAIAKYRRDRAGNPDASRPKQKKAHVYLHKQIVEYDWDGLVMRVRTGSGAHPHVEPIPLTYHAAFMLRGRQLGEPLVGDDTVMIPYTVEVEKATPSCIISFVLRLGFITYARYDLTGGALSVGSIRNDAESARITYYQNRRRLRRADVRVRTIHERKHGSKDANRRKAFLDEVAAHFAKEGALVVVEDLTVSGFAGRRDKRFGPLGRDRIRGGLPSHKIKQTMINRLNKAGLPVLLVKPAGMGSLCPACGGQLRSTKELPRMGKWPKIRPAAGRMTYCDSCDLMVDRSRAAAVNILAAAMRHSGCREWFACEGVDLPSSLPGGVDLWSALTFAPDRRDPVDAAACNTGGAPP